MTSNPQTPSTAANVRQHIENAVACLRLIGSSNMASEYLAAWALQEIFMAAAGGEDPAAFAPDAAQEARELMLKTCADVDSAVAGKIPSERLYFYAGVSSGLLAPGADPFRADRLDYAGILAAELRLISHRRNLNARGFPLLRDTRIRRAWAAPLGEAENAQ